MTAVTTYIVTCDACGKRIQDGLYVDASVYGKHFHVPCYEAIKGPLVQRALYLDDIEIARIEDGLVVQFSIQKAWASDRELSKFVKEAGL